MAFPQKFSASVYANDSTTLVAALPNAFGMGFVDEYNGYGRGRMSLSLSDANSDELIRGRFIRLYLNGVLNATFKIEADDYVAPGGRGAVNKVITVSGRGRACIYDEPIVDKEPAIPDGAPLDPLFRNFWCFSPGFPNLGDWGAPTEQYEFKDGVAAGRGRAVRLKSAEDEITGDPIYDIFPSPVGFPWPLAPHNGDGFAPTPTYVPTYWTTADGAPSETAVGMHFFRGSFTLAGSQQTKFAVTGDNWFLLVLQSAPILGEDADMLAWVGWKEVTIELPAGDWLVGAMVENVDVPELASNPGGFLFNAIAMSVYPGEVDTSETIALLSSNAADWLSTFSADFWPGYTPGQILQELITEIQARGGLTQHGSEGFTDFLDSGGAAWDSADPDTELEFVPLFAVRMGETVGKALEKLHQEGWIDWHVTPAGVLEMWSQGTGGVSSGVSFVEGVNIGDGGLRRSRSKPYANALRVQWAKGFIWVTDPTEITAYGTRVEDMYSTDAATPDDAARMGRIELARRTASSRAAIRMSIEPVDPDGDDCPYIGFQIGDYVTIPTPAGGTEEVQVLTISCDSDEKGYAVWSLELGLPWLNPDQSARDLLRAIGGKSVGTVADLGITRM